ncbi:amino acid ABC transporter ATP-binding protein [Arthrobacter sp. NPDC093128]|uniref:amino acid ABC transporter ATP-binding protein n=1 Tax=Arthrobacter sp. NPDC093128 TaxID=3154979 RepID=UPI003434FA1E
MLTQTPTTLATEVVGLHKSYGHHQVLEGVDLAVKEGEVVAIIGPSGSGKSTFIRCLNLLETPTRGTLRINGRDVWKDGGRPRRQELQQLRREVGMVFQSFNLFPTQTALENVSLAQIHALGRTKKQADERSLDLLTKVGLASRVDHKPAQLSGGQQQRVAIARAMALDPKILLFDEPTSAIDPELRVEVLRVMRDVAATGVTMLVVTHEMQFAEHVADRVVFFADGNIVEQGTPQQIFHAPRHERTKQFLSAVLEEGL